MLGEQLDQIGRVDAGLLGEVQVTAALTHLHPANAKGSCALAEGGQLHQGFGRLRQEAEAVDQLHFEFAQLLLVRRTGDPLVHGEPHIDVRDVVVREQGRQAQLHLGVLTHELFEGRLLAMFERLHRLLQHLHVEGEADRFDLAALIVAQQLACAADLQIVGGERKAGAEIFERRNGLQPLGRILGHQLGMRGEQVGIGLVVGAADPAPQLVQLGQAQMIRPVHDDGVGAWHVDAGLDDGGADQQVEALVVEVRHHPLELPLAHLAVGDADARLRHQLGKIRRTLLDALHVVVQVVDLTATLQFPQHRLAHHRRLVLAHEGLDSQALGGRGGDDGEIPHARHRHVEGTRNGGRREGEDIHVGAQRLDLLLLAHPEAMLLVDDEQAQILEGELGAQQLVGADDDVHLALGHLLHHRALLLGGAEAAQHLDPHRPVGEAVAEVVIVLLGQEGGGHQHGHLLAAMHGHKRRPHRHLGLAKAHVAAHQPVHALGLTHVAEHSIDGVELIVGLLEREASGKLAIGLAVVLEGKAGAGRAVGVDIEQLGRHVAHLLGRLAPRLDPGLAAELVAGRIVGSCIAADEVQAGDRHEQLVATGVFEGQKLGGQAAGVYGLQPQIAADPVIQMHHRLTLGQLAKVSDHRIGA